MKKVLALFLLALLGLGSLQAQQSVQRLARRVLGKQARHFEFVCQKDTVDFFSLSMHGKKIRVVGNNDNSMAMGLNYYLKEYAHVDVSWYASQPVQLPALWPSVKGQVVHRCAVPWRFFLNYCTYGYTMVWWQWPQWERFIDWMALNGVNMPLALTGQEAVWQQVWREMGMTDDEIRSYFSGPAHLPWHRMANLDSFGGPLPQQWIDGQKDLQVKILARERELGMTPVLPAFAGHVPQRIAQRYPQANITQLSSWCGFEPTYFLNSTDSLFAVIQRSYLEKQTALYGTGHIYGVDPFNEMDPPSWDPEYLASVSRHIYSSLSQVDPQASWLQMSWVFYYKRRQWTPERLKAYLTAVPQGRMILLDYFCEKTEVWRETDGFFGQPFIWCYLGNFGGNTMLVGDLNGLDHKLSQAFAQQGGNMVGIGSTLESFDNSPQIFQLLLEHPWNLSPATDRVGHFVRRWADMRRGSPDSNCRAAWRLLADSVYKDWSFYGLGTQMVARPSLAGHGTYYTKPYYSYDNATLLRALHLLLQAETPQAGYQYDVANLLSQWLGNHFMEVRDAFAVAYRQGDVSAMSRYRDLALEMIDDADRLLNTVEPLSLSRWVADAHNWGTTQADKHYYETQARTLLTIWGGPVLNDYANRMWGGLLSGYYRMRWQMFFDSVISAARNGRVFNQEEFLTTLTAAEQVWTRQYWDNPSAPVQGSTLQHATAIMHKIDQGHYAVPDRARQVLTDYMRRFPQAQLQDVYKLCFQDIYGPGHIIKDSASCAGYITREMEQVDTLDTRYPDYEYAGIDGNFVRVNIKILKQHRFDLGRFVQLLMQSASQVNPMPLYDWRGQWQRIQNQLRTIQPQPLNFDDDAARLDSLFNRGEYVFHHSTRFNQTYAPHYRLIRRDLFEKEILPQIAATSKAQNDPEDFDAFFVRFRRDCPFQQSRLAPDAQFLMTADIDVPNSEPEFYTVKLSAKDWKCATNEWFDTYKTKFEQRQPNQQAVVFTVEDTGIYFEWMFQRIDGRWFLKQVVDYSM